MTTAPAAISYDDALAIAGAELKRIWDHYYEALHPEEYGRSEVNQFVVDTAPAMWQQMMWTLSKVYGVEYEDVEGEMMAYL